MMKKLMCTVAAVAASAAVVVGAGQASAAPGQYTRGGDVLVELQVFGPGCATVTWPKGNRFRECYEDSHVQGPIYRGDRFGAKITSRDSDTRVACQVTDLETGDLVYADYATGYGTADCIRRAR